MSQDRRILILAMLLVITMACVSCSAAGDISQPAAVAGERPAWSLELQLSGSIAGLSEQLTINDAGLFRFVDQRKRLDRLGYLAPERRQEIAGLLAGLPKQDEVGPTVWFNGRCRDCLVFRLSWRKNGTAQTVRLSSDRLEQSPYRELLDALLAIMKENSSPDSAVIDR